MFPSHSASLVRIGATAAFVMLPFAAVPADVARTAASQPVPTAFTQPADTATADSRVVRPRAAKVKSRTQVVESIDEAGMSPYGRLARMAAMGRLDAALERARGASGNPVVPKISAPFTGADDGTTLPGGQADMSIAVDASGSNVVVVFNDGQGLALSPVSVSGFAWSSDGGATFTVGGMLPSPQQGTFGGLSYPQVFGNPDVKYVPGGTGCQFVVASVIVTGIGGSGAAPNVVYAGTAQTLAIHRSVDCGHTWSGPFEVAAATNPTGTLAGSNARDVADRPSIDVDPDTGRVLATWSNFTSTTVIGGGVEIRTAFSDNVMSGTPPTWSAGTVVNGASADFDTGSMVRFAGNGSANAYIAWARKSNDPAAATPYGGEACGNAMFARSVDNGATWSAPVKLHIGGICVGGDYWPMDQIPGNDRVHSHPAIAVDTSSGPAAGNVYVVYSANDAKDGGDVHFVRSVNGGTSFSTPVRLNARPGVDRSQWFPHTTVAPSGRVYVIWYDQQGWPSGDWTEMMMTLSDDGGATWQRPAALTERPFHAGYGNDASQPNLGERIGATSHGDMLYAVWAGNPRAVSFTDGQPASVAFTVPRLLYRRTNAYQPPLALAFPGPRSEGVPGYSQPYPELNPGDRAYVYLPLTNFVTNPVVGAGAVTDVVGTLTSSTPGVTFPEAVRSYGAIPAGATASSSAPFVIQVPGYLPSGTKVELKLALTTANGTTTLPFELDTGNWIYSDLYYENFSGAPEGGLPSGWTSVHEGGGTAVPWGWSNKFCGAAGLYHPGGGGTDPTRHERAVSPPIVIPPAATAHRVIMELWICYETEDDPDFNVLAYDGLTLRVVDETTGRVVRSVLAEAFAPRIKSGVGVHPPGYGYPDHLPKHLPRSGHPGYFQDMSVWAGSSRGLKSIYVELDGIQGSNVRLSFDYTQDGSGTCLDAGHAGSPPGTCGVLVGGFKLSSVANETAYAEVKFTNASATPSVVAPGASVTYRFRVVAVGMNHFYAEHVVFNESLPAGSTFVSLVAPPAWACTTPAVGAGGSVTCVRVSMAPLEAANFEIVAKVSTAAPAGTSCGSVATVTTNNPEQYLDDNFAEAGPCIVGSTLADVVAGIAAPASATAGTTHTYTLTVDNRGPSDGQAASLAFDIPADTTFASASQTGGTPFGCTLPPVGGVATVSCTAPLLPVGGAATFAVTVNVIGAGTLTGRLAVGAATADPVPANNVAIVSTPVSAALLQAAVAGSGNGLLTSSPPGLSCPGTCTSSFPSNATVRLNAAASPGSVFAGWAGACTGTGACVITMDKVQSVTATFAAEANSYVVTLTPTGSGTGRVDSSPSGIGCGVACAASFAGGSTVTLTAASEVDAVFVGWTGACSGIGACTLTMNGPQTVAAEFAVAVAKLESSDFDDDTKSDLVWRDANSGTTQVTLMNGLQIRLATTFQLGADWAVTHVGDFDGDGKSDLVWHNESAAETSIWIMDGTQYVRGQSILAIPGWTVTHVADFDGDGKDDLLWRNAATAEVAVWLMNGPAYVSGSIVLAEPLWSVSHVGDFNGDGKSDLVWRNVTTGQTALWLMDGATAVAGGIVLASTQWTATAVGDFDDDGKSDLVWRNATTGETAIWLMNGIAYGSGTIVTISAPWAVTHVADLDGDGRSDLIWRNGTTGATAVWLMNGTSRGPAAVFSDAPDWLVRRTADLNGDGKADLVWRNRVNNQTGAWLMDGTASIGVARPLQWPAAVTVQ